MDPQSGPPCTSDCPSGPQLWLALVVPVIAPAVLARSCGRALVVPVIVPRWRHVRLPKHAVLTHSCAPTLVVPVIVPTSVVPTGVTWSQIFWFLQFGKPFGSSIPNPGFRLWTLEPQL